MRKAYVLLFVAVFSLLLLPSSTATVSAETPSEVLSLNLRAYPPARILVSYAYTQNYSLSDVSSLGKSIYRHILSPTSIEFQAEDVDQYTFTATIRYAAIVEQSIQIAVFSGNHPPEAVQFNVKSDTVRIQFTLTVEQEPRYPTSVEVAEQVVRQISGQLEEFRYETRKVLDMVTHNLEIQWVIIGLITAVTAGYLVYFLFYVLPVVRQSKQTASIVMNPNSSQASRSSDKSKGVKDRK